MASHIISVSEPVRFLPVPGFFCAGSGSCKIKKAVPIVKFFFYNTPPSSLEKNHLFSSTVLKFDFNVGMKEAFRIYFSSKLKPELQTYSGQKVPDPYPQQ